MRKKIVRKVPFSPNVSKVIYEDGTWGLLGQEGSLVPQNETYDSQIEDTPYNPSVEDMIEEDPMKSKYLRVASNSAMSGNEYSALRQAYRNPRTEREGVDVGVEVDPYQTWMDTRSDEEMEELENKNPVEEYRKDKRFIDLWKSQR